MQRRVVWLSLLFVGVGVAGGVAVWKLARMREAMARAKQELQTFEEGLSAYYFAHSRYPTVTEGVDAVLKARAIVHCAHVPDPAACLAAPRPHPKDPWGNGYRYKSDGPKHALLSSAGPDGRFDTGDDLHLKSP